MLTGTRGRRDIDKDYHVCHIGNDQNYCNFSYVAAISSQPFCGKKKQFREGEAVGNVVYLSTANSNHGNEIVRVANRFIRECVCSAFICNVHDASLAPRAKNAG